jgi:NitT/TauT family transport system ATP-binding protein
MIHVHELSRRFTTDDGSLAVLDGVAFDVAQGEVFGIVGPSGCGKSTLLRIMAGLLAADDGYVALDGSMITEPGAGSVLVFQEYGKSLFPWKTVAGNVRIGAHGRTLDDAELERILEMVRLQRYRNRYPFELSGGMQQRVALARALVRGPRVILMDEPFGSLDGLTRYGLQNEVLRWAAALGVTVVLVTHDLDEVVFMCNRIAVLSSRPARVIEQFDVALPWPRDPIATRRMPAFTELRAQLQQRLALNAPA